MIRATLLILVACKSHEPRTPVAKVIDAAVEPAVDATVTAVDGGPPLVRTNCDQTSDWNPSASFLGTARVVHLRVAASRFGARWSSDRCVALDLELIDSFRGGSGDCVRSCEKAGDHIQVIVRQSMIEHYTSRPAGAWWIVEQTLEPGTEYVAFCPAGALASTLVGSCVVGTAAPLLLDLRFARDVESTKLSADETLARARAICKDASYVAAGYLWGKLSTASDPRWFDKTLALVEEPSCDRLFRATLFDAATGVEDAESPPQIRRLALAMFRLLAMPQAADLHDNLIVTYIPNIVGLEGGMKKLTAADVFAGQPARRAEAVKALAAYKGTADLKPLRAWLN